jgi:hypothetical protein
MKKTVFLGALLLVACGPVTPEPLSPVEEAWRSAQGPSVYALLGYRDTLGLSTEQVMTLDSVAEALQERNRPLADSLREITRSRGGGPVREPRTDAERETFTRIAGRIGANNRAAASTIEATLTPEQRRTVCELQSGRRPGMGRDSARVRGRGGPPPGGARRSFPGMAGDSLGGFRRPGGWPWCARPGGPPSADTAR